MAVPVANQIGSSRTSKAKTANRADCLILGAAAKSDLYDYSSVRQFRQLPFGNDSFNQWFDRQPLHND